MIKLLVVDDSALLRKLLAQVFSGEPDFAVQFARNGLEALEQLKTYVPDVITLDIHMPHMDGLACLDRIMVERPRPVVMVSSLTAEGAETTLQALRLGAVDFVTKPEGAMSLHIDDFSAELKAKIRTAAGAKLKASMRLRDRVRHISGGATRVRARRERGGEEPFADVRATGKGLVLVGTSTGGPTALESLLAPLPAGFPWPILVAQHMPSTFTGPLARRLNGLCAITVVECSQPLVLEPGCAYIGRGDADLIVARNASGLIATAVPSQSGYPWHPSTDRLVRSAMTQLPSNQLIGVLMTGMGDDGAAAMALLRRQGGKTIAEAEETAVVWGMPGELVKADGADWVLPLPKIADRLMTLTPAHAADP